MHCHWGQARTDKNNDVLIFFRFPGSFLWFQGELNIQMNSTVTARSPVQVTWDFRYSKVRFGSFYNLFPMLIFHLQIDFQQDSCM